MLKTTKAKIIFVTIFSIICILVTVILILYHNIDIEENIENKTPTVNKENVPGINLKGTYNQNDLSIEEKAITQEKVEIRYLQINGLKDKNVQYKINKEIEQIAIYCYKDKVKDLNQIVNVQVSMWEASSFANTISFELAYTAKIDDDDDGYYQGFLGLNYDLNTGNKITIDRIFTSDAPIEKILRKSSYHSLLQDRTEDNLEGNFVVSDYGNIEDEMSEFVKLYKSGKVTEFYYTPTDINIYYKDNQIITIKMEDFAEYIAIYNRYLNDESIYESNKIGLKNLYTLTRRYNDVYHYTNYQNESNYFVDISIDFQSTNDDVFAKKIIENKIIQIEKEIDKIKQKVKENSNNFYILNYYISIYTGEERSMNQILTSCYERGNSYVITMGEFKEKVEPIIIKYNRQDKNGGLSDYIYDFTHVLDIQSQETIEYYNPETEEKIVI